MKRRDITVVYILILFIISLLCSSCSTSLEVEEEDNCVIIDSTINPGDSIIVYKPNIYIYPENETQLAIQLTFTNGGYVTVSDPEYGEGWDVIVEPNGMINGEHTFLFYECKVPNYCQFQEGWVVDEDNLATFFESELETLSFREHEIADFIDYWIPMLNEFSTYTIYPQYSMELEQMVIIDCNIEPNSINRVWYVVKGYSAGNIIPIIPSPQTSTRTGFHIMEWGVIL